MPGKAQLLAAPPDSLDLIPKMAQTVPPSALISCHLPLLLVQSLLLDHHLYSFFRTKYPILIIAFRHFPHSIYRPANHYDQPQSIHLMNSDFGLSCIYFLCKVISSFGIRRRKVRRLHFRPLLAPVCPTNTTRMYCCILAPKSPQIPRLRCYSDPLSRNAQTHRPLSSLDTLLHPASKVICSGGRLPNPALYKRPDRAT